MDYAMVEFLNLDVCYETKQGWGEQPRLLREAIKRVPRCGECDSALKL